eukprot:GHVS01087793.1.p2 GENE.GHVS01087793.1~~GHVS01087793.1.p2  ORF type:complete len:120 (-),score=15.20 GHVS01087793.1:211-570(-)
MSTSLSAQIQTAICHVKESRSVPRPSDASAEEEVEQLVAVLNSATRDAPTDCQEKRAFAERCQSRFGGGRPSSDRYCSRSHASSCNDCASTTDTRCPMLTSARLTGGTPMSSDELPSPK